MKKYTCCIIALIAFFFNSSAQTWLWAKDGSGSGNAGSGNPPLIAEDKFNNIFLLDIMNGPQLQFVSYTVYSYPTDIYLLKYDQNGNVLWAAQPKNETGVDWEYALATDKS